MRMVRPADVFLKNAITHDLSDLMVLERLGFVEGIRDFVQTMRAFPDGFTMLKLKNTFNNIGYLSTEIWKEYPTAGENTYKHFDLKHSIDETHYPFGDVLYISSMAIHPSFRGMYLGHFLVKESISKLSQKYPKLKSATLIVNEDWISAASIYKSLGFKEKDRIVGFFKPVMAEALDGVIMEKVLT